MSNNMQIFISGSFDHEDAEALFSEAGELLESIGFVAIMPGKTDSLTCRLKLLLDCDGVLFLRNWHSSKESRIEKEIAEAFSKLVLFEVLCSDDKIQQIKDAIRNVTGFSFQDYTAKGRKREVYFARLVFINQVAAFCNSKEIGSLVNRDLTTVVRCLHNYQDELRYNKEFRTMVDQVAGFLAKCVSQ